MEVWTAASRAAPRSFEPWMRTVVRRRLLSLIRKECQLREDRLSENLEVSLYRELEFDFSRCAAAMGEDFVGLMQEGHTLREIAALMGTTVDALNGPLARLRTGNKIMVDAHVGQRCLGAEKGLDD